ncbi:MAG: hypothetical protein HKN68_15035 [Saprospiraceae bacterium]|nr:hypothetical protein [Saprospiraceae bacterium]
MKIITKIALVGLIVGFPLASWYYLNNGLEYRRQALKDLAPKGQWTMEGVDKTDIEFYTNVIFCDSQLRDKMQQIYDQYAASPTFQMIEVTGDKNYQAPWKSIYVEDYKGCGDDEIYLLDVESQLRNTYTGDEKTLGKLVEHIAIVLPREKDPDIIVKNHEGE